jgi:hypothetical protein
MIGRVSERMRRSHAKTMNGPIRAVTTGEHLLRSAS